MILLDLLLTRKQTNKANALVLKNILNVYVYVYGVQEQNLGPMVEQSVLSHKAFTSAQTTIPYA